MLDQRDSSNRHPQRFSSLDAGAAPECDDTGYGGRYAEGGAYG